MEREVRTDNFGRTTTNGEGGCVGRVSSLSGSRLVMNRRCPLRVHLPRLPQPREGYNDFLRIIVDGKGRGKPMPGENGDDATRVGRVQ